MCPYLLVQKTREQNLPSPSNIFKDLFCLYWLLTFINFICCFAWETEVIWGWCISITISMAFDSKDSKIKIITKNTNTANTPNELGLQINTQNVVLYFKKKKNTLLNPLNQSVFCLYLLQLRPMVTIIHIQCFSVCAYNTWIQIISDIWMLQFPWRNMTGRRYSWHSETDLVVYLTLTGFNV